MSIVKVVDTVRPDEIYNLAAQSRTANSNIVEYETRIRLANNIRDYISDKKNENSLIPVNFCKERGLEFYAVNSDNQTGALFKKVETRKLRADLYIDDRNIGGIPDWDTIYEMVTGLHRERDEKRKKRRGLFGGRK